MTPQQSQILGLPVSFDAYLRHGWKLVAIPPGSKGPRTPGWNRKENTIADSTAVPPGYGVGLAHAYSGTMALDIDNWQQADSLLKQRGIDLNALYSAPDAVTIESGREGRGKLIYAMPFGLTLPTKRINWTQADGTNAVTYELRCATLDGTTAQDVLPPTMHPETLRPYQWGGRGHWSRLPMLPIELLSVWQELTAKDSARTIKTDTVDASIDELRHALMHINPSCDREQWVSIGMALQSTGKPELIDLWDEWSQQSPDKYKGRRDIEACWRSFKPSNGITIGTLFHYAHKAGYTRPTPDVTHLFKDVTPEAPPQSVGKSPSFRPVPPDIDLSVFPEVLQRRVKEVAESVGCDPLVPLMAGLAAISAVADKRSRLEIVEGFKVPPLLWLMTIGDPSGKKTPGAAPMLSVLRELEKEDYPRYQQDLLRWEILNTAYEASRTASMKEAAKPENVLSGTVDFDALPPIIKAPDWKPAEARLEVRDITSQKLVRIVADRQRGVLCHLDEMGSWCQKVVDPRSGEDKSAWTASFNAGHYVMDRVGEKASIQVDNYAVAIFGNLQPQLYKKYLAAMTDDGLLQRFIPAVLRNDRSELSNPLPDMFSNRREYETMLRQIYATPTMTYKLDSKAYEAYREFQVWYEEMKRDERIVGASSSYLQAFGKLEGTLGRIALVMHLIESPGLQTIGLQTIQNAVKFVKGYVIPIYRFTLGDDGGFGDGALHQKAIEWVLYHSERTDFGIADIRKGLRRWLEDVPLHQRHAAIHDAVANLESMGWVTIINDHYTRASWAIHPGVKTVFADHRKELIRAKQRLKNKFNEYTNAQYGRDVDPKHRNAKYAELLDDSPEDWN